MFVLLDIYSRRLLKCFLMSQNHEFIKNRSFEIAWAVFRCASLVKQEKLKKELEDAAIELLSHHSHFSSRENILRRHKKHSLIRGESCWAVEKLTSFIKLSEAIGEIKIINARVLYRELDNISQVIQKISEELSQNPEEEILIENIFSTHLPKSDLTVSEVKASKMPISEQSRQGGIYGARVVKEFGNGSAKLTTSNSAKLTTSSLAKLTTSNLASYSQDNSAKASSAITKPDDLIKENQENPSLDSWQDLIFRKIREFGKTSTKEIAGFFPEISERTVRFYLQRLSEIGLIERIGTSGPGSYYIYKKTAN